MQKGLDTILSSRRLSIARSPQNGRLAAADGARRDATRQIDVTTPPRAPDRRRPILVTAEMTMLYRCMTHAPSFAELSDRDLIAEVQRLAGSERAATAAMVACLAEMDTRRLYLGE